MRRQYKFKPYLGIVYKDVWNRTVCKTCNGFYTIDGMWCYARVGSKAVAPRTRTSNALRMRMCEIFQP